LVTNEIPSRTPETSIGSTRTPATNAPAVIRLTAFYDRSGFASHGSFAPARPERVAHTSVLGRLQFRASVKSTNGTSLKQCASDRHVIISLDRLS
jgi:hypothetical protein